MELFFCLPSFPTMSGRAGCSDTASIPRVDCCGRQNRETGISTVNLSLSADTKAKFYEGLSNDERWSLTCFIYPDYQIRPLQHFVLRKGRFLGLTFLLLTALAYKGELEPQLAKQNVRSNSQFLYERVQSSWFLHFVLYVHSLA